ncbi:hypothetical protein [Xanthomonas phaseoli]
MAAAVAWISYLHRKDEVARAASGDFQARAARYKRWLIALESAKYPFFFLKDMDEKSMPEIYKKKFYR